MRKILVPVDGSEHALRAVAHVARLHEGRGEVSVHLLNVEPAPVEWQTHGLESEAVRDHLRSLGERKLEAARELLRRAGLPHEASVLLGDPAPSIARAAKDLGCDEIVMGTRGLGSVTGLVLGSVATKVVHLVDFPVTLVK